MSFISLTFNIQKGVKMQTDTLCKIYFALQKTFGKNIAKSIFADLLKFVNHS